MQANPYRPILAKVVDTIDETPTIRTYALDPEERINFKAGQFISLGVPGLGEGFFTPSSSPFEPEKLETTIMRVGRVTTALEKLKKGDVVTLRGPFGKPYPLEKFKGREVFLVGGGVGMAPLRSLLLALLHDKKDYKKIVLRYGARTPRDLVYAKSMSEWAQEIDLRLSVDVGDETWKGNVGVVTTILDEIPVDVNTAVAVVCGPPIMMHFVNLRLLEAGFKDENIYHSMEKVMSCGIGKCGHCQLGEYLCCKDGPVLTWAQIKHIKDPF